MMSPIPSMVSKTLQSPDRTPIYAEVIGDPGNTTVVLVHGLSLSGAVFDNLFTDRRLTEKLYLVRYDLRGHGQSGKPLDSEGYTSSLFSDDFAALAKEFRFNKPILLGWSYGATVLADIVSYIDPVPVSGVIYLTALPYVEAKMVAKVATPRVLGYLDAMFKTDDTLVVGRAKVDFIESFLHPEKVSYNEKVSWLGQSMLQPVDVFLHILSRPQDPEKLFEVGEKGLPLLLMNGAMDNQVQGDVVVEVMNPYFKDIEVKMFHNGSHALFYDCQDEFVESLLGFVNRVTAKAW